MLPPFNPPEFRYRVITPKCCFDGVTSVPKNFIFSHRLLSQSFIVCQSHCCILVLILSLKSRHCYYPHFTDEQTGAGRENNLHRVTELVVAESGFEPGAHPWIHTLNHNSSTVIPLLTPSEGSRSIFRLHRVAEAGNTACTAAMEGVVSLMSRIQWPSFNETKCWLVHVSKTDIIGP